MTEDRIIEINQKEIDIFKQPYIQFKFNNCWYSFLYTNKPKFAEIV